MIDTADMLEILDYAHPSPLWAAIVEGLEKVAVRAELYGWKADQTENAVTAAYDAITGCFNDRLCCACHLPTDSNVICDRCRRELL